MKKFLLALLLFSLYGHSQVLVRQTLGVSGNSKRVTSTQGNYFLQQSIGQTSVINTFATENKTLRQGFLQILRPGVIGSNPNELEMIVYPNSFIDGVVVNLENTEDENVDVFLFDMTGRLILHQIRENSTQITVPLENLSRGVYFFKLQVGQQHSIRQLIKQ
ncbi:hypothetical protein GGR42_000474 [Saonia flava]|uniref:Secretion system C-terminal sorting domain-containing protein n=1 Tax=Saonia flava TaxID=523696 RepID=A0A846QU15_9FLAO|nr:T9SS type A sorting domain-containing protein [Saonia flava]NJB70012.1 hypothetical protein [Saonia flava]